MISVIIPIYNGAAFLPRTIRCLQAQLYSDFEVLLINDGSSDDSEGVCREAVQADGRFRLISQKNSGVSAARNRGIACASGEYITFLDADDEIPSNYLQELLGALTAYNAPMAVCDVAMISSGEEVSRFTLESGVISRSQALNHLLSRRHINSGPCAKLFRREILLGLSFPPLRVYEDIPFVTEAMCRCDCIAVTDQTEYRYLQNSGSAMGTLSRKPSMDIIKATEWLLDFLKNHPELDATCFYISVSHLMQYVQMIIEDSQMQAPEFLRGARRLIRKCIPEIVGCSAFPAREKVVFVLFAFGWLYHRKKIYRV